ncbi:MAG: hypothetical protein KDC58_12745 [Cyclobacteriaceae bacterium]|nr:hypothetical protein [Cyclobacteriaceae bacterium]
MTTKRTIERLGVFINALGITISEFERSVNMGNGYIGKQLRRKGSIGSHIIEKILVKYPQLNVVWLMTGKERMITSKSKAHMVASKHELRASA